MNFRRTRAMARKELLHIVRDPRSLMAALTQPVLVLLLFGYALSLDVDRIPTMIYDADRSAESQKLVQEFRGSRYFQIVDEVDSYRPIERRVWSRLTPGAPATTPKASVPAACSSRRWMRVCASGTTPTWFRAISSCPD
jgi:hypothetical protein